MFLSLADDQFYLPVRRVVVYSESFCPSWPHSGNWIRSYFLQNGATTGYWVIQMLGLSIHKVIPTSFFLEVSSIFDSRPRWVHIYTKDPRLPFGKCNLHKVNANQRVSIWVANWALYSLSKSGDDMTWLLIGNLLTRYCVYIYFGRTIITRRLKLPKLNGICALFVGWIKVNNAALRNVCYKIRETSRRKVTFPDNRKRWGPMFAFKLNLFFFCIDIKLAYFSWKWSWIPK